MKLIIVGGGESRYIDELKALVKKLGIAKNIIFTGFVKKENVKDYFSAADIGVWPGNNSVSIMEAMACRLPIIMVDLQLSHLVGYNNGIKFQQHDKKELKLSIKKLAENKNLRTKMADNSFEAIKKNYSYDKIAERFLELVK